MRKKRKIKRRKKNSIFKSKAFWSFIIFLNISAFAFLFLFFSEYVQLKETTIAGAQTISEDMLLSEFNEKSSLSLNMFGLNIDSQSIFIPSQGKMVEILETFPEIEDLEIKKNLFTQKITLEIVEKIPVCVWCTNGECVLLDKNATYIRDYNDETGFIVIKEFDNYEDNLQKWSDKSKKELLIDLLLIYRNNEKVNHFSIYNDKFFAKYEEIDLIFDPKEDMDWQIEKMKIILQKLEEDMGSIEYIDLRFGEQAIVK